MMAGFFHLLSAGAPPNFPPGMDLPSPLDYRPRMEGIAYLLNFK
jgi:hypothetical protein